MQFANSPIRQLEFSVFTTQEEMCRCSLLAPASLLIPTSVSRHLSVTCTVNKVRYTRSLVLSGCSEWCLHTGTFFNDTVRRRSHTRIWMDNAEECHQPKLWGSKRKNTAVLFCSTQSL